MRAALDNVERRIRASIEVPEVVGDFIPLRVTFDSVPHVICVGWPAENTASVEVNGHRCALHDGKFASPPLPYHPGVEITVRRTNHQGKTREFRTSLPGPDGLGPVFGPDWTPFGPPSAYE